MALEKKAPESGIRLERIGGICIVRLNRPEARNALSEALMCELRDLGRDLAADTALRAVVLTGTQTYFSAGADLKDPAFNKRAALPLIERRQAVRVGPDMCRAWEDIEAITIAAIEGYCVGGAVALAAACDFRIGGRGAKFRLPEVPLAMNMSWQSLPRLVALIGPSKTKMLTLFGEFVEAEAALSWGLVDNLCADGKALDEAMVLAEKAARLPPVAARMAKEGINKAALALANATSFMDGDQYLLATRSEDHKEAIRAFRDKRMPDFKGE